MLQSVLGVTNYGILEGASNGLEMLAFFIEPLRLVDDVYGNPVLANGDTVVMGNCGFHHGRFAEAELRRMLEDRRVELIFQPPYSPEFDTAKALLSTFTEMAILPAIEKNHTRNVSKIL